VVHVEASSSPFLPFYLLCSSPPLSLPPLPPPPPPLLPLLLLLFLLLQAGVVLVESFAFIISRPYTVVDEIDAGGRMDVAKATALGLPPGKVRPKDSVRTNRVGDPCTQT